MSLYLKYRPDSFETVIGNGDVVLPLQALLKKPDRPHVFLFHGPTGCGKTTLGRIVAGVLGCRGRDFHEVDSADFRGIDTIRDIRRQSRLRAIEGPCSVWLLDECHKLSNDAMNALLKALEDTPGHVFYILCTTDPQKLLPTIRGRCNQYQVQPLDDKNMLTLLRHVVKAESGVLQKAIYDQIIQSSQGRPRDALQILEKVLAVSEEKQLEMAAQAIEIQSQVVELCRALLQRSGWKKITGILFGLVEQDPETIRHAVLGYCQAVLLKEQNDMAAAVMEAFMEPFYNTGRPGLVFACYSVVRQG